MDLITADEVVRRIEVYFTGGSIKYLTQKQINASERTIPSLGWKTVNHS